MGPATNREEQNGSRGRGPLGQPGRLPGDRRDHGLG
jgi:hypothetical protein